METTLSTFADFSIIVAGILSAAIVVMWLQVFVFIIFSEEIKNHKSCK